MGIHLTCVHVPYTEEEKSIGGVSKYAEEKNLTAPIVLDQDYEIVTKYKIQGLPSFCLIDKEGQLKMGDAGWEKILKKLEKQS
ncbi:TlpA family protein disulfide reductase [Bacillus sp. A015]